MKTDTKLLQARCCPTRLLIGNDGQMHVIAKIRRFANHTLVAKDSPANRPMSEMSAYHHAAMMGEEMLDNEAEHGIQNWVSPSEIARLLLMRRVPKSPPGYKPSVYRVLGVIIPDLDEVMQMEIRKLPSPASPILPMFLRPALLAGVAIVRHAGPEMLRIAC